MRSSENAAVLAPMQLEKGTKIGFSLQTARRGAACWRLRRRPSLGMPTTALAPKVEADCLTVVPAPTNSKAAWHGEGRPTSAHLWIVSDDLGMDLLRGF